MKKLIFVVFLCVFVALIAEETNPEETNWIPQDGWVTGPGADENNRKTYLLPFKYGFYTDEEPILYETDMGWPVPDAEGTDLKYMFFGDTKFFMRDSDNHILGKITDLSGSEIYSFGIENVEGEIEKVDFYSPAGSIYLNSLTGTLRSNYDDCFLYCTNFGSGHLFEYLDIDVNNDTEKCMNFCMFDMIETYASRGYFLYDLDDDPVMNGKTYNNGTSNIFLAAELEKKWDSGAYQYDIRFKNPDGLESGSAQVHLTTDNRRSNSIWMNSYERHLAGKIGIYPRGYFYACPGAPENPTGSCQQKSKKLFVPYEVSGWNVLAPGVFCQNAFNKPHLVIPGHESTELEFKAGDELKNELERQKQSLGFGIYDFGTECRFKFSKESDFPNPLFPYSFPSCETSEVADGCYQDYPNKHILWPNLSKMSNVTVVHGIERDILSVDDGKEYIYFMGTGETEVHTDDFSLTCRTDALPDINYYNGANQNTVTKTTQKAYIARVRAYESEIKCAASYEYFAGITNGIARWTNNMEDAEPLYGFYPLAAMGAESIVKHRDLYWMTAPLNETEDSALVDDKKGFVVLASPDALHWQKVDTILFENPERIWLNYAFFWLPPKLIESDDNTMPFLYSVWKANETEDMRNFVTTGLLAENPDLRITLASFLDTSWDPKFTHYNLKSGKYKFMEEEATRAFLVNSDRYGLSLLNTIAGTISKEAGSIPIFTFSTGIIPLPFITFQNLDNLKNKNLSILELILQENLLKSRYVIIEYCYCRDQNKDYCKSEEGLCPVYQKFVTENGNGEGNWKIIDINENQFFEDHVKNCKNGRTDDPDYMCNIPFEHRKNSPEGQKNVPIWNWKQQIKEDLGEDLSVSLSNAILRFSHWRNLEFIPDNYTEINKQLMENNKLIPFDCDETGSPDIIATCHDSNSWRTTEFVILKYKIPFDFPIIDPGKLRLEYLYPYPVMINDFGRPGDPVLDIWDMLTADHFAREFFKVSSFAYGNSVTMNLMSGAAATAVIKNGTMTVYAWGGSEPPFVPGRNLYGLETLLYIGTYNPETEVVTFEQTTLAETEGSNSPEFTAGASMVYDDENDKIYLIGALDKNGATRIYSLEDDNMQLGTKTWRSVTTIDLGRYFRLVKKSEHEYFAFGGETDTNSFTRKAYLLDLNSMASPQALQDIPASGLANSFAAYSEMDQKLYVFGGLDENGASDRFLSYDIKTDNWSSINVAEGPGAGYGGVILVDYISETISLGGGVFENSKDGQFKWIFNPKDMTWTKELKSGLYCMKEADSTLQGGLEQGGECVPFNHPWYNSFSAGASVYSLDGKGNRLYVGTNNAIKVYDISDPTSPVLVSSFSTSSRVNDLEVYGDSLFAATNGGLYKLDASDPDELEQILFVSTGSTSQNEIELYDGKIYVGDDNGIKIRDKETFAVLLSANSGAVYDFAIQNGEIAMFRSSFWNSGIQFRDAATLVETAYDYTSCTDAEIETYNGKFYLACDNYTYSFEANNGYIYFTQLSGDKRDLRENYSYNGYTYTPDGNYIRLSTNEEVSAICGNGIVEGDEVCDGTPIDCADLDSSYVSGIAACNQTCDGYVLDNCTAGNGGDGW